MQEQLPSAHACRQFKTLTTQRHPHLDNIAASVHVLLVLVGRSRDVLAWVAHQRLGYCFNCVGAGPVQQRAILEEPAAVKSGVSSAFVMQLLFGCYALPHVLLTSFCLLQTIATHWSLSGRPRRLWRDRPGLVLYFTAG